MEKWRYGFIVDITNLPNEDITKEVEKKAEEVVSSLGSVGEESSFKVSITFYQAKVRWKKDKPQIPREDIGRDLDNLIKPILDGLGPIIGYRKKWGSDKETGKWKPIGKLTSTDSRIVELSAKKVNSGTDSEYLVIEVEKV